eukprot:CAMPEP_0172701228 /NCGR_PEP_ID=MMETSP1074-20121228/31491_1 /TAXON_ID=2916 /ORGANISM="Ceratium fusus, Strain PA161109" /LENGTH=83 /DNA_ID=CAMNT_0013522745 /DNA_START=1 /DNA_END=249 /DNA_ORIENTATION=+
MPTASPIVSQKSSLESAPSISELRRVSSQQLAYIPPSRVLSTRLSSVADAPSSDADSMSVRKGVPICFVDPVETKEEIPIKPR